MVNVAVAGGTSPTLGRSIVSAILATGSHKPIILSRTTSSDTKYSAPVVAVNYTSIDSLITTLRTYNIDTVISVLKIIEPGQNLRYHNNLLEACVAAKVRRFILSDWSLARSSWSKVDALQERIQMSELCDRAHDGECSMIQVGGFLEYISQGCGDTDALQAGLQDDLMADYIEIAQGKLVIPCKVVNGQKVPARVSMTSLWDVGRFVAASLDVPVGKLGKQIGMVGAMFDFEHVRTKLEDMNVKLNNVRYIDVSECTSIAAEKDRMFKEKMQAGDFDLGLFKERMVAQMYGCLCGEEAEGGVITGRLLNDLCPEVKTTSIDELLEKAWSK